MWASLAQTVERYQELERLMADPAVLADSARFTRTVKEHGRLTKLVRPYQSFQQLERQIADAENVLAAERDPEMRGYAEEELAGLRRRHETLRAQIEEMLLESSEEDFESIIMEIRAGTGGDEAAIFAGDLYDMYTHYARDQGWKVEEIGRAHV